MKTIASPKEEFHATIHYWVGDSVPFLLLEYQTSKNFDWKKLKFVGQFRTKMSAPALPEPVRVSPLIRVGRWTFLGLGILYGLSRHRTLSKREERLREIEAREGPVREAAKAAEKARLNREEMLYLARETGTPVPPGF